MLVLSRRSQETVVVGGADGVDRLVTVTVLEIGAGKVRLGFEAPAAIPVHRGEVWDASWRPARRRGRRTDRPQTLRTRCRPGRPVAGRRRAGPPAGAVTGGEAPRWPRRDGDYGLRADTN